MFHHISSCVTQKSDRSRCFIIYQAVLLKFYRCCSYARVRIGIHMTIVDPSSVRVLWLKAYQEARDFVLLFQGIQVQIPKQSFMIYIWKWRFADKAKKHKKEKDTEQTSVESIEDHYRVNYFLLFIDHTFFIISHLNSRFPQELKAIFYACVGWRCFTSIVMILSGR